MPSHESADHQTNEQTRPGTDERIQYVEELRSLEDYPPGDAWVSVKGAAYMTFSSPATVQYWVNDGRLPVKKEPDGSVPRPRLIRVSDVAQIRPIRSPTAAITGRPFNLDLQSWNAWLAYLQPDRSGEDRD